MRYGILAVGVFLGTLWAACGDSWDADDGRARVEIEEVHYQELPGGARILTGTVYNPTSKAVSTAQLQVSLFDESNRRIDGMQVVVRNIPPGERKAFREPVDSKLDVRGARVRSVLVL